MKQSCLAIGLIALLGIVAPCNAQIAPISPPSVFMTLPQLPRLQSYTLTVPGEAPVFFNEMFNGGWSVVTPGQPPIFVMPAGDDGGYSIISPGMDPVFFMPMNVGD